MPGFRDSLHRLVRRPDETALCMNSSYFGFFAHAGFLKGLFELGIRPDHVSGASAGALVAAACAAGLSPDEIISTLLAPDLRRSFAEWRTAVRLAGLVTGRRGFTGVLSGEKILALLKSRLGDRRIQDFRNPSLGIAVTNLSRGRTELKKSGPAAELVLASCALPGMFQASRIGGELYLDGGIADPAPFEHWLDDSQIRRIIVHLADSDHETRRGFEKGFSLPGAIQQSHSIINDEILRLKLALAEKSNKDIIVVRTITPRPGVRKMRAGRLNVELGRRSALESLGS